MLAGRILDSAFLVWFYVPASSSSKIATLKGSLNLENPQIL
jgi:hypothetical protein